MPRVVPDQKNKFESDDLFKRLTRESEVRYTGFRDRPQEERQLRFQTGCREGHTELVFVTSGTNLQLIFNPSFHPYNNDRECDFDKEIGKVRNILFGGPAEEAYRIFIIKRINSIKIQCRLKINSKIPLKSEAMPKKHKS